MLESDRIIIFGDTIDAPEYDFSDFRNSVVSDYGVFNENVGDTDTLIYYVSSTEQANYLLKNWPLFIRPEYQPTNISYLTDSKNTEVCQRILQNLYTCIESYLFELLPENPKRLDLSNVNNIIVLSVKSLLLI